MTWVNGKNVFDVIRLVLERVQQWYCDNYATWILIKDNTMLFAFNVL